MGGGNPGYLPREVALDALCPSKVNIPLSALEKLSDLAGRRNQRVWITGGTLRDLFQNHRPLDMDLAVSGDAMGLGRELAEGLGARFVPLKESHATCRLVQGKFQWDITGLRASTLEGDLRARDYTINAMALEIKDFLAGGGGLIDPTGGLADLRAGLLKTAGPGVLSDDPLRVLRAFRFMATRGFRPAPGLLEEIAAAGPGLWRTPPERVAHEWLMLMAGQKVSEAISAMEKAQILTRLIPDLAFGRGVWQNPYHHLDVFDHNLACVESLGDIVLRPEIHFKGLAGEVVEYLGSDHTRALLFSAALMHDLAKPTTRKQKDPQWATFYRHDVQGAKMARQACRRLGLAKADAGFVARLVGEHMRPFHLMGAARRGVFTERAVRRFLEAAGGDLPGLFALAMADTLAGKGPLRPADAEESLLDLYEKVAHLRDQKLAEALAAPPLLNGKDILDNLEVKPGPEVGRLLKKVREAQLDNEVKTFQDALKLARYLHEKPAKTAS